MNNEANLSYKKLFKLNWRTFAFTAAGLAVAILPFFVLLVRW